ncbi:MAG: L-rhamnose/proton symporter RhaT [Planctomycetia bacterium]|nr:L-rhamnose/proton symporter RhaT [Planctomycetia bacterium]
MFLLESYPIAVLFCFITMLCWGSWGNSQKAVEKTWRFELFYWDYVIGVLLTALAFAFTLGSQGELGRSFVVDLQQASPLSLGLAFLGGVVFNIANILLVAAIAISGMAVAFPVGIGLALILGVALNYMADQAGNPMLLGGGVALVALAIILNAVAYGKLPKNSEESGASKTKGLVLAIICGILMSTFYYFVAASLAKVEIPANGEVATQFLDVTHSNLAQEGATLQVGKLTPFTANAVFALGIFLSSFIVVTFLQLKPFVGTPVSPFAFFRGTFREHFWGILGGAIWAVGMTLNVVASGVASPAISYGLGQGATLIAAIWGVFVWREFRAAPKGTGKILFAMFVSFLVGLGMIIASKLA